MANIFTTEQIIEALELGAVVCRKDQCRTWAKDGTLFYIRPESAMLYESSYSITTWANRYGSWIVSIDYQTVTDRLVAEHLVD